MRTQLALRKALTVIPHQIGLRKIQQLTSLVLAVRHYLIDSFQQVFVIHASTLHQTHLHLLTAKFNNIAIDDFLTPPGFNLAIDCDLTVADKELGLAAGGNQASEFQEFVSTGSVVISISFMGGYLGIGAQWLR